MHIKSIFGWFQLLSLLHCIGLDFHWCRKFNILKNQFVDITENNTEHEPRDDEENVKNNKSQWIGTNKSWSSFCFWAVPMAIHCVGKLAWKSVDKEILKNS